MGYTGSAVFRIIAVLVLVSVLASGCGAEERPPASGSPPSNGGPETPVTAGARPASVPDSAQAVLNMNRLGSIERAANATPTTEDTRMLLDASCEDDVLRLETSEETIYGGLPCGRFWDQEALDVFLGAEMAIVLEVSDERFRILTETVEGAQAEFTTEGIWVE